ncbi:CO dehydrogenase/acetyl-CoA synthase subunit delta, TIM barrel [Thermincola ferriacetica]|uniref:CO dehydrogenase/acetyl-CoA synthase delta subunit, TIM barrel n=2 Tax=Thermincola TaxID=278993 RepID=D5XEF2_THEPJ|nr:MULTISPECIES: acetyl-CoA decarbonylase/synthase complex subunit gamma [Thermincola]ADG82023.1 CO dehydrogenase/acetyl-CoA synthase delta subunit, TIM barrel [Thermincola potens JR]KNZ71041.1 CO dehydrogenase/acetyl-CoA synthase subunit delta, TIM barrel [Thermincola ferriacetica]
MGLTGLEIFKQLPKKNCKECGQPTCLAFAMQLAAGKASLDACPYVSDAAREALDSASAPPVALIKIGVGEKAIELGNETVLFRHDKRFEHPTAITIRVSDNEDVKAKVEKINKLVFDRVGQIHEVSMVAITNDSGDAAKFAEAVKTAQDNTAYPLMLVTSDVAAMEKALEVAGANKPLVYAADANNYEAMTNLAKKYEAPLVVKGTDLNNLAEVVEKVVALGYKNLMLDSGATEISRMVADQVQIRRSALKLFRPFGYPTVAFATNDDPMMEAMNAATLIAKYAAVVVVNSAEPEHILPLITLRLNIYTDPQKPIAVESKIYEILNPGPDAPVLITTNFSLSYFCVAGDTEAARMPAYIIPVDTDGISVLTAWAAGKFTPESIADTIKKLGIMEKVNHNKIIIPGGVAVLSGKTAELTGCEVIVGPRESAGLPSFFKQRWNK